MDFNMRVAETSEILEIFFSFSLLILDLELFQFHFHFSKKEWRNFIFHISLLEKGECFLNFTLFSLEMKSGAGYHHYVLHKLTSFYPPDCISIGPESDLCLMSSIVTNQYSEAEFWSYLNVVTFWKNSYPWVS